MRKCNECTLCCRLVPVGELQKPANKICKQQGVKGCRVYREPGRPLSCKLWSCWWLADAELPTQRPDRAHYVIDPSPDFIEITSLGAVSVIQIWVDPRFPNAHHDPQLRAWLAARFKSRQQLALVRFDSHRAIVLFPPESNTRDEWVEVEGQGSAEHSLTDVATTLLSGGLRSNRLDILSRG